MEALTGDIAAGSGYDIDEVAMTIWQLTGDIAAGSGYDTYVRLADFVSASTGEIAAVRGDNTSVLGYTVLLH